MTLSQYNALPLEKRKKLFAAKLLPVNDCFTYWGDYLLDQTAAVYEAPPSLHDDINVYCKRRDEWEKEFESCDFSLDDLQAVIREADEKGWWPSPEKLRKHYLKHCLVSDIGEANDRVTVCLDAIALIRALVFGEPSFCPAGLKCQKRVRCDVTDESVIAAVIVVIDVLVEGEPRWNGFCQSDDGVRLILGWLTQAFSRGREIKATLAYLQRHLLGEATKRKCGTELERQYCACCVWLGLQEGLDAPWLSDSPYVQGCRKVLTGDIAGAYRILVEFSGEGCGFGFAPLLLLHAVCMAVKPSVSRAIKIMRGLKEYPSYDYLPCVVGFGCGLYQMEYWTREWGTDGKLTRRSLRNVNSRCMEGALRFAWGWHGEKDVERASYREEARTALDFVARAVKNGYVNIGGIVLSLMPEMANESAVRPILETVRKNGVWILPFKESEPTWVKFLGEVRRILGVSARVPVKADKQVQVGAVRGRIVWELGADERGDGGVDLHWVRPTFRKRLPDGSERSSRVGLRSLTAAKYCGCVNAADLALGNLLLSEGDGSCVSADVVEALCGMSNIELVKVPKSGEISSLGTCVRIEQRPYTMSSTVTEDGSTVLGLPDWRHSDRSYALMRTEQKDVLAFMPLEEEVCELIRAFEAFGMDGKITLPPEAWMTGSDVLEKLGEVLPVETANRGEDADLPKVKAKSVCVVYLEFADRTLGIRVLTRPINGNAELLFEPGIGPVNRQVDGAHGAYLLVRDLAAEKESLGRIRELLADCDSWFDGRCSWQISDVGVAIAAVGRLHEAKPKLALEWKKGKPLRASRPEVKLTLGGGGEKHNWFAVQGTFEVDGGKVYDIMTLLSALRQNDAGYVELSDGDYVVLTQEIRKQLGALAAIGRAEGSADGALRIPRGALPFLASVFGGEGLSLPAVMKNAAEKVRVALALEPEPPRMLEARLRPYQLEGYRWLSRLAACGFGACLADDMGLGKTLQTIALLLERAKDGASLVVSPASVCGNWRSEIRRFAPTLEPIVAMEENEKAIKSAGPRTVVIASYGYLLFHERLFKDKDWNGIVLDEAQAIKNADAKRTKLVKELKTRFRVAATGTPVENRIEELWSLFDFLNPGLLGTRDSFAQRSLSSVKPFVKPLVLRRLKSEVLDDLPQKTEVTRFVELGDDERSAYEACRMKAAQDVAEATKKERMGKLLAGLTRLRRFCCNPSLVLGGKALGSAKLEALAELMEELREGGHRALVFSQFTDYLAIVRKMVGEKGWSHQYLDGETPLRERGRRVEAFQNGEGDFFLISLKAGGIGLNLTAADYVIILDPWWNPAVENQAADRAYRIGQRRPITIYRLIAKDTVEERVLELHRQKQQLFVEVLDDTGSSTLTSEQLIGLLQ